MDIQRESAASWVLTTVVEVVVTVFPSNKQSLMLVESTFRNSAPPLELHVPEEMQEPRPLISFPRKTELVATNLPVRVLMAVLELRSMNMAPPARSPTFWLNSELLMVMSLTPKKYTAPPVPARSAGCVDTLLRMNTQRSICRLLFTDMIAPPCNFAELPKKVVPFSVKLEFIT